MNRLINLIISYIIINSMCCIQIIDSLDRLKLEENETSITTDNGFSSESEERDLSEKSFSDNIDFNELYDEIRNNYEKENIEFNISKIEEQSKNSKLSPINIELLNRLTFIANPLIRTLSPLSDIIYESNLSPECLHSIIRLGNGIKNHELWALKCEFFHE